MELSKVLNKISQEFLTAHLHVNTFPRTALKEMFYYTSMTFGNREIFLFYLVVQLHCFRGYLTAQFLECYFVTSKTRTGKTWFSEARKSLLLQSSSSKLNILNFLKAYEVYEFSKLYALYTILNFCM